MIVTDEEMTVLYTLTDEVDGGLTIGGDDDNQITVDFTPLVGGRMNRYIFINPSDGPDDVWFEVEFGFYDVRYGPNPNGEED